MNRLAQAQARARREAWAKAVLAMVLFALASALYLTMVEQSLQNDLRDRFAATERRSMQAFDEWFDTHAAQARAFAADGQTQTLVRHLRSLRDPTPAALTLDAQQVAFRAVFTGRHEGPAPLGYFIVAPDGKVLAALNDETLGLPSPLWNEPEFVTAMDERGAALSPLLPFDVPPWEEDIQINGRGLSLFIGVPIRPVAGAPPLAYLLLRLSPMSLLAVQGRQRFGERGLVHLVDRFGRVHADPMWLNIDRAHYGLQSEPFRDAEFVFARDPGRNLLLQPGFNGDRSHLPLTVAARALQQGDAGVTTVPYRDMLGVEVVGSWRWLPALNLGAVVKLPAREAFASREAARRNVLAAATVLAVASAAGLLLRLRRSQRELRAALVSAESANRAKSAFLANMSHEIRTPLNAVLGITHLLQATPLTTAQRNQLQIIGSAGSALLTLLNDILDYSKVEAGKLELTEEAFSLPDMIDTLASIMSVNAAAKRLELLVGIEPDVPARLIGDAHRLLQVLVNLTGNAIKFTPQGRVMLHVRREPGTADGPLKLRFEVSDTGIGMSPGTRARLFSPFSQADAGIARSYGGTGLGLAICKRLVDLMGGEIDVASQEGEGSTFWFVLPLQEAGTADAGGGDDAVHKEGNDGGAPITAPRDVLVAGGSRLARECTGWALDRLGWPHRQVETPAAACRDLIGRRRLDLPGCDLVLLDGRTAEGEDGSSIGPAAWQALRSDPPDGEDPRVIVLADAHDRERLAALPDAQAPDAVLVRPVTPSRIVEALRQARAQQTGAVMPLTVSGMQPAATATAGTDAVPAGRLAGWRLLLAEDNPVNQLVACGMLEAEGATVIVADDGQAALDWLARAPDQIDAVLMDVQMPVLDGLEATRRLRTGLALDLPVVGLSAGVTAPERDACRQAGMDAFVAKPIDPAVLTDTLVGLLAGRTAAAGSAPASPLVPAPAADATVAPAPRHGPDAVAFVVSPAPIPAPVPVPRRGPAAAPSAPAFSAPSPLSPAAAPEGTDLPGIDRAALAASVGHDRAVVARLLGLFEADCRALARRLDTLADDVEADADLAPYRAALHAFKGAAANMRATVLAALAQRVHDAARRGDVAALAREAPALHDAALVMADALARARAAGSGAATPAAGGSGGSGLTA